MGKSLFWIITARLFLVAWMWFAMAVMKACIIASNLDMDSPFNVRRHGV